MSFISYPFVIFFAVFFILYWSVFGKNLAAQNVLLFLGNCLFYVWANWFFLPIIFFVIIFNFFIGLGIADAKKTISKKLLLWLGLLQGLGGLFLYKYYNFVATSLNGLGFLKNSHFQLPLHTWLVPLGISFFTFKTISYLLDVYQERIEPTRNIMDFANYVFFFPTIVSGPIDRSRNFIPQLNKLRVFEHEKASDALRQILWGLFKKTVIADSAAELTNMVFNGNPSGQQASTLVMVAILYTFELYADFSGYSDMAIGIARLMGFNVAKNFDYPFFSDNIAEFWRKWHISLTSWLTDYVFTPLNLAFRDLGKWGIFLAIFINFSLIGIWHGANWTYLVFGIMHAFYYIPLIYAGFSNRKKRNIEKNFFEKTKTFFKRVGLFFLITITFIMFRSSSVHLALEYYKAIFSSSIFLFPYFKFYFFVIVFIFIGIMLIVEWLNRKKDFPLSNMQNSFPIAIRYGIYILLLLVIIVFHGSTGQFVYANF
jgi:D-alanyl-lipoteichoic acid acyltransferase DltB (MBOAT superfamily)